MIRTALFTLIPFLAASVAAQATPIFGTVTFTCDGSFANCAGSGTGTSSGNTALLSATESDNGWSLSNNSATLQWFGTGSGTLPSSSNPMPISWDFSIAPNTPSGGTVSFSWELIVILNNTPTANGSGGTKIYDSGMSTSTTNSQLNVGSGSMNLNQGVLAGTTLGNWDAELFVSFQPTVTGNGVTITTAGTGVDLNPAPSPEPSTWGMAGGCLLFAWAVARRKLRRG
jgi:hypothetical protein